MLRRTLSCQCMLPSCTGRTELNHEMRHELHRHWCRKQLGMQILSFADFLHIPRMDVGVTPHAQDARPSWPCKGMPPARMAAVNICRSASAAACSSCQDSRG